MILFLIVLRSIFISDVSIVLIKSSILIALKMLILVYLNSPHYTIATVIRFHPYQSFRISFYLSLNSNHHPHLPKIVMTLTTID